MLKMNTRIRKRRKIDRKTFPYLRGTKIQKWIKLHSLNDNIPALNLIKIRHSPRIIILGLGYFQKLLSLT